MIKKLLLLGVLLLLVPGYAGAGQLHSRWADLLSRFVDSGVVDYLGFKRSESDLDAYLTVLATTEPSQLREDDRLALYINAYNAYTIKLILNNFKNGLPPTSIRKIGGLFSGPWDIALAEIGGETYTLDDVEHEIIRKQFREPRIHFAVNCASKSCPPLISKPYEGDTLDSQLEKSTREFLMDPDKNYLDGDTLYLSKLFKWYGEDFNNDPVAFFLDHTDGDLHTRLKQKDEPVLKYKDYDWSLNGRD